MKENLPAECRGFQEDLWSSWPLAEAAPPRAVEHAAGCPACGPELESFRALCRRSATASGAPLAWSGVLPAARWARLAAATKRALRERPAPRRPLAWASALALAAVASAILLRTARTPTAEPLPIPAAAVERYELFERLDLFEHWDELEALPPERPAAPARRPR